MIQRTRPNPEEKTSPNTLAKSELALMPSLAGRTPRSMFHANTVVMADLKGCGLDTPSTHVISEGLWDRNLLQDDGNG